MRTKSSWSRFLSRNTFSYLFFEVRNLTSHQNRDFKWWPCWLCHLSQTFKVRKKIKWPMWRFPWTKNKSNNWSIWCFQILFLKPTSFRPLSSARDEKGFFALRSNLTFQFFMSMCQCARKAELGEPPPSYSLISSNKNAPYDVRIRLAGSKIFDLPAFVLRVTVLLKNVMAVTKTTTRVSWIFFSTFFFLRSYQFFKFATSSSTPFSFFCWFWF